MKKATLLSLISFFLLLTCKKVQGEADQAIDFKQIKWAKAIFAGGCFWCMEPPYDKVKGVKATISGYCGGNQLNPTYKQVANGKTKYAESVLVLYDPKVMSYEKLIEVFWMTHNPTQKDGQFYDIGRHYRSSIFYLDQKQKNIALKSKTNLEKSNRFGKPIVTEIVKAGKFYAAEAYHQDYYKKNPLHYYDYRRGSGRDAFIKKHWSK